MKKEINGKTFKCHEQSGLFVAKDGEVWIPKSGVHKEHTTYGTNNGKGYLRLMYHGKYYYIHRLVAETYIPNPQNLSEVNHKDETPSNNNVGNLEWCTPSYNINYGTRNQKVAEKRRNGKQSKHVAQYDLSGNLIATYPSVHEVYRQLGYNMGSISQCCNGKLKTAYKYLWKYA